MILIGIDNGLDGGIVAYNPDGGLLAKDIMPTIGGEDGSRRSYDVNAMREILYRHTTYAEGIGLKAHVYLEHAQAFPGQGVTSMFSIGFGFGLWQGLLSALCIPYTLVRPQAWQKVMFEGLDRSDTKKCSALVASRLFPSVDWRATERSRKPHDGLTDAACIASYGKRHQSSLNP